MSVMSAIKQYLITEHNKDTDKLKSPDITKILINNTKLCIKISTKTVYKSSKQYQ